MNYNTIAILYIISLIVITLIYKDPFTLTDKCDINTLEECNLKSECKWTDQKCENKFNQNAKYLIMIFGLLIFYLFFTKVNLSYLLLDLKFKKMMLIIPFFYIFILIIIYIYLNEEITLLICYNFCIMILFFFIDGFQFKQNLINIMIGILSIIGIVVIIKQSIFTGIFQSNYDNCTNKLQYLDITANKFKDAEINQDTCYSLEELQTLYKTVSSKKDCSFCVDYVDNEFNCQTNSYCNKNMKKKYDEDCKNSDGHIKEIIKENIDTANPSYILECNELDLRLADVIEIPEATINKTTTISQLYSDIIATQSIVEDIAHTTDKKPKYGPQLSFEKNILSNLDNRLLSDLGIQDGSTIDLTFVPTK